MYSGDFGISCANLSSTNKVSPTVAKFFTIYLYGDKSGGIRNPSLSQQISDILNAIPSPSTGYGAAWAVMLGQIGLTGKFSSGQISTVTISPFPQFIGSYNVTLSQSTFVINGLEVNTAVKVYAVIYQQNIPIPTAG